MSVNALRVNFMKTLVLFATSCGEPMQYANEKRKSQRNWKPVLREPQAGILRGVMDHLLLY